MMYLLLAVFLVAVEVKSYQHEQEISFFEKVRSHPNWPLLDQGTYCGTKFPKFSPRIMGGVEAKPQEFPWMVLLQYNDDPNEHKCGGFLMNDQYVLTAAHCCVVKEEPNKINNNLTTVRLGEHEVGKATCRGGHCSSPKDVKIEFITSHKNFNGDIYYHNDICLLRLQEKIKFSENMYPICLPVFDEIQQDLVGTRMTVAGWGVSNKGGYVHKNNILNKVQLNVKPLELCQKKWYYMELLNTQLCAGCQRGKDACAGDSGGPLMYRAPLQGPSRYFAMGIISYGRDCNREVDSYNEWNLWGLGVYTKVSDFIPWILDHIRP